MFPYCLRVRVLSSLIWGHVFFCCALFVVLYSYVSRCWRWEGILLDLKLYFSFFFVFVFVIIYNYCSFVWFVLVCLGIVLLCFSLFRLAGRDERGRLATFFFSSLVLVRFGSVRFFDCCLFSL